MAERYGSLQAINSTHYEVMNATENVINYSSYCYSSYCCDLFYVCNAMATIVSIDNTTIGSSV